MLPSTRWRTSWIGSRRRRHLDRADVRKQISAMVEELTEGDAGGIYVVEVPRSTRWTTATDAVLSIISNLGRDSGGRGGYH